MFLVFLLPENKFCINNKVNANKWFHLKTSFPNNILQCQLLFQKLSFSPQVVNVLVQLCKIPFHTKKIGQDTKRNKLSLFSLGMQVFVIAFLSRED